MLVGALGELLREVDKVVRNRGARLQQSRELSAPLVLDLFEIQTLASIPASSAWQICRCLLADLLLEEAKLQTMCPCQ